MKRPSGFTLLELSIVLVIIGLLIGAIIVGKTMYESAKLRSVVSALEKYESAIITFKITYNAMPGDMQDATVILGASRNGNGNGIIERQWGGVTTTTADVSTCTDSEFILSNEHLARANLISLAPFNANALASCKENVGWIDPVGRYSMDSGSAMLSGNAIWITNTSLGMTVSLGGRQMFLNSNALTLWSALNPYELYYLDTKMDDGLPRSGRMWAQNSLGLGAKVDWSNTSSPAGGCQELDSSGQWIYSRFNSLQSIWRTNCVLYKLLNL